MPAAVATVEPRDVILWDEFSGRLEAVERIDVRARVGGAILATHFAEGELVKAGDLLVTIDPAPYAAEVQRLEAQVAGAEARVGLTASDLERGRRLSDQQWEVILGGLLGDGALSPSRSGHGARFRWGHGAAQVDYGDWKASLLANLSVSRSTSDATKAASSCALSATYPVSLSPSPASLQRRFGRREALRSMTALAADRIVCVER